ncbi:MAG: hypothetical protein HY399_03550 [Elusimicrobia bacterium]|nr:hypothetical protein [Elusimicrobiota bacterium]
MFSNTLEILSDLLESPSQTVQRIVVTRPIPLGFLAYLVGAVSLFLSRCLAHRGFLMEPGLPLFLWICFWQLSLGFFLTALAHLFVEMGGGSGSAKGLFVLLGLSELVWAVTLPVVLILGLFLPVQGWEVSSAFLIFGFLNLFFKAKSIQVNYGVPSSRAWFILALPYLLIFILPIVFMGLTVWGIIS